MLEFNCFKGPGIGVGPVQTAEIQQVALSYNGHIYSSCMHHIPASICPPSFNRQPYSPNNV